MNFLALMDMPQAIAWGFLATTIGGIVIQIIILIKQGKAEKVSKVQDQKLDVIHEITNDRFSKAEARADIAIARVDQLEKFIKSNPLSEPIPLPTKQTIQEEQVKDSTVKPYPKTV